MSTSSARISTLISDPFDPAAALQNWDQVESPTSYEPPGRRFSPDPDNSPEPQTLTSPGFDPSYPFSPGFAPASYSAPPPPPVPSRNPTFSASSYPVPGHDVYEKSPPSSPVYAYPPPPPPPPVSRQPGPYDVWSPSSPAGYGTDTFYSRPFPARLDTISDRASTAPSTSSDHGRVDGPPPTTPGVRFGEPTSYEPMRMNDDYADGFQRSQRRQSQGLGLSRNGPGSIRRTASKLMSSLSVRARNRNSIGSWGAVKRRSALESGNFLDHDGNYMELGGVDERDEALPVGVDISSWGPEFVTPSAAFLAMRKNNMDDNKVYTGTGDVIDLTNLTGLKEEDFKDGPMYSSPHLSRAGTFENTEKMSYYFPPSRKVPNWKPVALRTWFLIMLILVTIALLAGTEILYQQSNSGKFMAVGKDGNVKPGLFDYTDINSLPKLYFGIWKYVPTVVGVLYGIIWKVTDEGVKRGEPYYQLSKGTKGALAAESLNIEYHTIWSPFVPIAAFKHRQFVVAASGIVSFLAVSAVPILLSVFIRVHPNQKTRKMWLATKKYEDDEQIAKTLVVDGSFARLLEATLGFILILAVYVTFSLAGRKSGLLWDPSGVAGVAAMANKSHILMDFKKLDTATEEEIHKQLNKRTYILHRGALWHAKLLRESERDDDAPKAMNAHPLLLRVKGMVPFLGFAFCILIMLPCIVYVPQLNDVMDRAPWLITGVSVIIKTIWELVEKDMRMLEPWWMLYKRNAAPDVLTLDYTATIPGVIVIKALLKHHFLLAWVTFMTLLIEVLTVVMGSLDSQGGEESNLSSKLSFALALLILVTLLFTGGLVLKERRKPFLPRQPGTISSALAFIHQSHMLTDFNGTEEKNTAEREKQLWSINHRYGFGWYVGRDGKRHLGIDKEPLLKSYVFGEDPREGVVDGPMAGSWEVYEPVAS